MSSYNLGLAFYRKYYDEWDFRKDKPAEGLSYVYYPEDENKKKEVQKMVQSYFIHKNGMLKAAQITASPFRYPGDGQLETFSLQTIYPGLLLGSGYAHGIGQEGEHKIGFYFDHTTGLPVIPGASVKGAIRSVFPGRYRGNADELRNKGKQEAADLNDELAAGRLAFLKYLLVAVVQLEENRITDEFIRKLEAEIFDGIYAESNDGKPLYMPLPYRDVFHDALLTGPRGQSFLADGFVTPHRKLKKDHIPDALKNPNPVQFLKIPQGIDFTFQFHLPEHYFVKDPENGGLIQRSRLITAAQRRLLFQNILQYTGIGAKTNVGYGRLKAGRSSDAGEISVETVKEHDTITATVTRIQPGKIFVQLSVEGYDREEEIRFGAASRFQIGQLITVEVKSIEGRRNNRNIRIIVGNPKG